MALTIGQILALLKECEQDASVYYDFALTNPTTVESWRGDYSLPALGYGGDTCITVEMLISEIELSVSGKIYEGWKGGDYVFNRSQTLHVANPGKSDGDTCISGVTEASYCVILDTKFEPYI